MKKMYKKYEMLSAYLDNELSDAEKKKIEEEMKFSKELQEKYSELKRLKKITASSIKSVPENPYFETKLAATMRTEKPFALRIRKFAPVIGIVAASVILMVVLRYNPKIVDNLMEQQQSNIASFYKQNLKPLLYTANLSNEDIFDFAFYHQLPLDNNKKQFLQLGSDQKGNQFFEIKHAGIIPSESNLEKFVKVLKLNNKQKSEVDSILQSYAPDLQAQVLVNNNNTVAINPNIWNFNKAMAADLIAFAAKISKKYSAGAIPPELENYYNHEDYARMVNKIKSTGNEKYIFLTPDSIFSDSFKFDKDKFSDEMKKWSHDFAKNMRDFNDKMKDFQVNINFGNDFTKLKKDSSWEKDFKVFIDSNGCRVHLSKLFIPPVQIPDVDSLISYIDSTTGLFNGFSFNLPKHKGKNFNYKYFYKDSSKGYNFNFKAFGFDSSYTSGNKKADSLLKSKFKNFNFPMNPDSLASMFKFFYGDSNGFHQQKQLQRQMKEFQKEMENFRKEMEEWQKQFKKDTPVPKSKKPMEI